MGLLEKALQYKQEINKKGKETLIDTITGPADTELVLKEKNKSESLDFQDDLLTELSREDLKTIEPVEDELFILPEDDKKTFMEEENTLHTVEEKKVREYSDTVTSLNGKDEYLGPEDEPDLDVLQSGKQEESTIPGSSKSQNNTKFKIVEQAHNTMDESLKDENDKEQTLSEAISSKPDKKFQDFVVLYEIGKEIVKSKSLNELYDTILFSVMGQIGSASSTLLVLNPDDENSLMVADSRGITIKNKNIKFDTSRGLFKVLMQSKGVVDIEKYKQQTQYRDEYYQLIAIDARLFVPLRYNALVFGALVLGDKITIGDYNEEEIDFIEQVSEFAAIAYEKVKKIEYLESDIQRYLDDKNFWQSIEEYKQSLRKYPQHDYFKITVQNMMKTNGILSFAVFVKNNKTMDFSLLLTEEDDVLLLNESVSIIKKESPFLDYIASLHLPTVIEDFDRNKAIKEVFTESCMRKMTVFWIYPFQISGDLLGFVCVFRLSDYQLKDLQFDNFRSLSDVILTHYWSSRLIEYQYTNYIDVIAPVFNRISKELNNASKLSIPLTIVLFTIKNLKRYYIIQGFNKTKELIDKVEDIIHNRLSEGDFTAKIDRHKFLIVLPGKNKKFAVPFANALKNEIVQQFSQKELQLLVTFLMAEYPEDGNDMYSLLDAID